MVYGYKIAVIYTSNVSVGWIPSRCIFKGWGSGHFYGDQIEPAKFTLTHANCKIPSGYVCCSKKTSRAIDKANWTLRNTCGIEKMRNIWTSRNNWILRNNLI